MTVDITIGKREESAPLYPCSLMSADFGCTGQDCRECAHLVRQEKRADAPPIQSATTTGVVTDGFNFTNIPTGAWFRFIEETGLVLEYPWMHIPSNDPIAHPIPDGLGMRLHRLAVQIELGQIVTTYPTDDAEFACWMAWWCIRATKDYGLLATIETH